jgi:hypothetical protein
MQIFKVLPELARERQLKLWHKALRSQWSAEDIAWDKPVGFRSRRLREALAKVLSPVLMGEQTALYSVSAQIPRLGSRSEVESQFYLTTWAVDEARHTELFARYYRRLEAEPLSIRRFPEGYLFQAQITAKDTAEWLSGVLVSEVLATLMMRELVRLDLDPVLSEIAEGILRDEARHLGFNHVYLEERFAEVWARGRGEGEASSELLERRLRSVLDLAPPMLGRMSAELDEIGVEWRAMLEQLELETSERLRTSVQRGAQVASGARETPRGASALR